MNIVEFLTLVAMVAAGYHCGKFLASYLGLMGWITGLVVGGAALLLVRNLAVYVMGYVLDRWYPSRPPCKNGKCLADDYTEIAIRQQGERFAIVWQCKCGTMYVQRFPYFREMLSDGSVKPYMRKLRGKWKPDIRAQITSDRIDAE